MIQKKTEGMSYIGWSVEDFKQLLYKRNRRLNMEEELSPFERLFLEKAIANFKKVMIDITKESIEEGADPFITEELITVTAKSLKDKLLKKE